MYLVSSTSTADFWLWWLVLFSTELSDFRLRVIFFSMATAVSYRIFSGFVELYFPFFYAQSPLFPQLRFHRFLSLLWAVSASTVVGSIVDDSSFWKHRSGVWLEQPWRWFLSQWFLHRYGSVWRQSFVESSFNRRWKLASLFLDACFNTPGVVDVVGWVSDFSSTGFTLDLQLKLCLSLCPFVGSLCFFCRAYSCWTMIHK